ncbi:MAG: DMT family transporter [Sneathiella sp.]
MSSNSAPSPAINSSGRAYLFLTFTTLCWGGNAIFSRLAVDEVSPMTLVALRWLSVMVILLIFARGAVRRDWDALKPRLGFLFMLGAFGFTGFNALFYVAAHTTTAVNIGILQGSIPVFVFLGALILFKTPISPSQMAGVALTIVGVIVVGSGGSLERLTALDFNFGDLLMIIACLLYACYTIALRFKPDVSALSFFTILACAAFVATLPLLAGEIFYGNFQAPTLKGWGLIAAIAIFPSFLAQLSFINGVTLIGPGRAGVFVNLVPIFASIMAVIFLNEPFELYHGLSLLLVLGGIWLAERGKKAS